VRKFARERLRRTPRDGIARSISRDELEAIAAMGLCGVAIPEEWNGAGMDYTALAIACEEISAGRRPTCTIVMVTNLVANICSATATTRRKEFPQARSRGESARRVLPDRAACGSDAPRSRRRAENPARTTC
jgi:alkylation response protein AidB-like acyl-CoA dehydrogenase